MTETWRAVPGFEGSYEVSDLGRVRSLDRLIRSGRQTGANGGLQMTRGRILKTPPNSFGYPHTQLGRGNTRHVHTLVLLAFRGPAPDGMSGCHNDGDPCNNKLSNLRWDTQAENMRDRVRHNTHSIGERNSAAVLTDEQVIAIHADPRHRAEICADYGISEAHVSGIKRRRAWGHLALPPVLMDTRRGEMNRKAKLTSEQVLSIRADTRSSITLGREFGVSKTTINRIKSGQAWAHI